MEFEATEPPYCPWYMIGKQGYDDYFSTITWRCTLYVPEESIDIYRRTYPLNEFRNILPIGGSGPTESGVELMETGEKETFRVYDLRGVNILNTEEKIRDRQPSQRSLYHQQQKGDDWEN